MISVLLLFFDKQHPHEDSRSSETAFRRPMLQFDASEPNLLQETSWKPPSISKTTNTSPYATF